MVTFISICVYVYVLPLCIVGGQPTLWIFLLEYSWIYAAYCSVYRKFAKLMNGAMFEVVGANEPAFLGVVPCICVYATTYYCGSTCHDR